MTGGSARWNIEGGRRTRKTRRRGSRAAEIPHNSAPALPLTHHCPISLPQYTGPSHIIHTLSHTNTLKQSRTRPFIPTLTRTRTPTLTPRFPHTRPRQASSRPYPLDPLRTNLTAELGHPSRGYTVGLARLNALCLVKDYETAIHRLRHP